MSSARVLPRLIASQRLAPIHHPPGTGETPSTPSATSPPPATRRPFPPRPSPWPPWAAQRFHRKNTTSGFIRSPLQCGQCGTWKRASKRRVEQGVAVRRLHRVHAGQVRDSGFPSTAGSNRARYVWPQSRHSTRCRLPCSSITSWLPAWSCRVSTFWVIKPLIRPVLCKPGQGVVAAFGCA